MDVKRYFPLIFWPPISDIHGSKFIELPRGLAHTEREIKIRYHR
jgi:hypothetical protein